MVVQVGELRGDVNLRHGRPLPAPNQLPIGPSNFVNRTAGLEIFRQFIHARPSSPHQPAGTRIVAINGPPGVGKTALALHWAHQNLTLFPDGTLYIDLQTYSPAIAVSTANALEAFIRAFGVAPEYIPGELNDRSALFRSLVSQRRMLVIIDNAASSAQVRPLLPASPECHVVVTSRTSLSGLTAREGAMPVRLDVLSPEESVELLFQLARGGSHIGSGDPALQRVAELCGYLPLTLRLVGERAASRPGLSFAELADEIVSEQDRLDQLAEDEDELTDTRAVFSWSYQALPPDLKEAFRLLGLHAGPEFRAGPVAALLGSDMRTATRRLRSLSKANLVRETAPGTFRLHDLLRIYARELVLAEESQERRTHAVRRELSWYLLTTDTGRRALLPYSTSVDLVPAQSLEIADHFDSGADAMEWFLSERLNILAAVRQSMEIGQFDITWKIAVISSGFLELSSYWPEWQATQELGLEAARTLGDRIGEALNTLLLGDAIWRSGDLDKARNLYEQSGAIGHDLKAWRVEAYSLRGVGLTYQEQGYHDSAIPLFEASLSLFREAGFKRGEGMSLASLGKCAAALGDPRRAVAANREAIALLEDIEDTWSAAWTRLALAAALEQVSEDTEAIGTLQLAADVFGQFRDRQCEGAALTAMGRVYNRIGDRDRAEEAWRRALDLYEGVDDSRADEVQRLLGELTDGQAES